MTFWFTVTGLAEMEINSTRDKSLQRRQQEQVNSRQFPGGRFKREGTYVYLWLIHVDVWQKPTQFCKAIILQLKKFFKLKKKT